MSRVSSIAPWVSQQGPADALVATLRRCEWDLLSPVARANAIGTGADIATTSARAGHGTGFCKAQCIGTFAPLRFLRPVKALFGVRD